MRTRAALTAASLAGLGAVHTAAHLFGLGASELAGYSPLRCLLFRLTGQPCPTCGLTRSLLSASLGRFGEAFDYHPFGPVLLIGFFIFLLVWWVAPGLLSKLAAALGRPGPRRLVWPALAAYCVWGFFLRG